MEFNTNAEVWVDYSERVTTGDDGESEALWYVEPAKIVDFLIPFGHVYPRFKFKVKREDA
jgi:hypothetical protein